MKSFRPRFRPDRAIILAAGFGTRMLPLSRIVPKPLMPLWGKPILLHVLRQLQDWGVRSVLINCHYRADALLSFARSNPVPGLQLNLSFEPEILGTGGVLQRASWFLGDDPFWMLNADVAMDLDPALLLREIGDAKTMASLWIHPIRGPRTVEVRKGMISSFRSAHPGQDGTYTFCGLHLISPRILMFIPEGFSSIISAYERAMQSGMWLKGVVVPDAYWADIGTPDQYLQAHRDIAHRSVTRRPGGHLMDPDVSRGDILRNVWVGPRADCAKDADIENTVVWPRARIGVRAILRNAIVAPDVTVNHFATGILVPAEKALDSAEFGAVESLLGPLDRAVAQVTPRSGSARSYTRIRRGHRSIMLMRYSSERKENALFAGHSRFLARCGIRVPNVLIDRPKERLALLEDVGDISLQVNAVRKPRSIETHYRSLLETVHELHHGATRSALRSRRSLMPPFSPRLFRWEHELFANEFLRRRSDISEDDIIDLLQELAHVASRLRKAPHVLLHRDLQSSNVLLFRKELVLIDFQGMRLGPAAYDLASLLCDPYVSLQMAIQERLLVHYSHLSPTACRDAQWFWWAAIQRLSQAIGSYGRLALLPGGARFATYVQPALRMMQRAVRQVDDKLPALNRFVDTFSSLNQDTRPILY